jgi:hypothetical protein
LSIEADLLAKQGLDAPDGRSLFAYGCDEAARAQLAHDLIIRLLAGSDSQTTAARFVLWAADEIRVAHTPGHLTWEWLFSRIRRPSDPQLGRILTERGLVWWRRPVRRSESGHRHFLYSLMAEGGLPEAYLAQAPLYRGTVLAMLSEIEAEGSLAEIAAERIAWRRVCSLPQTFRHQDTILLLSDLALALARLRARLPADLPTQAAEAWLDQQIHGWRDHLPLRFSVGALEALIRPALRAVRGEAPRAAGPLCRRELRRRADGTGWAAYAVVSNGAQLPARFLLGIDTTLRLRFLALGSDNGPPAAFLGVPEGGGWRLARTGAASETALRLDPEQPLVLAAHSDGRPVGDAVADAGLPPPAIAPSFWRALDPQEPSPSRLEPLSGRARTSAARLWLLTDANARPIVGDELTLGEPEPAPGGRLWPVTGCGTIILNGQRMPVVTRADSEAQAHRLHLLGRHLPGWRCEDGQIPFLGQPEAWGAEGDAPLRRLTTGVVLQAIQRRLGGQLAAWRRDEVMVARSMFVALPQGVRIEMAEVAAGIVRLRAAGLSTSWHLRLRAAEATAETAVGAGGDAEFSLQVAGEAPASLQLRVSDPASGARLVLVAAWPARRGMIVAPEGARLVREQGMAVGGLGGWRGVAPPGKPGTLLLRCGGAGLEVGVQISGEVRLAAAEPLARLMLALDGFDAEIRLNLVVDGTESPRLMLRRYDNGAKVDKGVFVADGHVWRLHAVPLDPFGAARRAEGVEGSFDLAAWLGDTPALWLVQARAASGSVARPAVWSVNPLPFSTRDARIAGYAEDWRRLLDTPASPEWDVRWQLIRAAHDGGDAGVLDQVQALGEVPAAAVVLLFRVPEADLGSALALEGEAPIWWPAVPVPAWTAAVAARQARGRESLRAAGFDANEMAEMANATLGQRAGAILALRPELRGHLGAAFASTDVVPVALSDYLPGGALPLAMPNAASCFRDLMQEAARRDTMPPEGTAGLPAARLSRATGLPDHLRALLDAPLVAAEIATGLIAHPDLTTLIRLIALRQADPIWFDAALPAAVQLYLEEART